MGWRVVRFSPSRVSTALLSLVLMTLVACSSTVAPVATAKAVAPPTVAPATATAVVPATATAAPAPTAVPATPTPVVQGGKVTINTLYVCEGCTSDGKATGGTEPATITVAPKTTSGVSVLFGNSEVGGMGNQWQAAAWTAAVQSALLLGLDPSKLSFTYQYQGRVDGPSAGALLTIGTLAAILGDTIPKDFAMTGTINPDGTIGPVGGIPHKIDGAAKAGIKTMLVPVGQRTDLDENTKQMVDLVRRGQDQGVNVQLVSNIYDAYQIATGKALPQPQGAAIPSFPSAVSDKMSAQASTWLATNASNESRAKSFSAEVQKQFAADMSAADKTAQAANQALQEGNAPVALERAEEAVQTSLPAERDAELYQTIVDRGVKAGIAQVQASSSTEDKLNALYDRLRAQDTKTASDAVTLMDAYSNAIIAEHSVADGDAQTAALVKNAATMKDSDVIDALFVINDDYTNAETFVDVTTTELDLFLGQGSGSPPSLDTLNGLGELLRQAGQANLAAFNATTVADIAQQYNVRDEVVEQRLANLDGVYADALYASQPAAQQTTSKSQLTQSQQAYYVLGAALDTYALSTELIAKYYSLDAQLDKNFDITGYGRETALVSMLNLGQKSADSALGIPKDVPLPALYYADNADFSRNGDAGQQMDAMFYYWQSTILSKVMANMTGEWGQKIQSVVAPGQNARLLQASAYKGN